MLRPGIGPDAGLAEGDETQPRIAARPRRPGSRPGGLDGGVLDPGGGFDPPPPPPPLDADPFRVEILSPDGTVVATTMGPMAFELPHSPTPQPGGPVGGLPGVGRRWVLRATNTSRFRANLTATMFFRGNRPVLSRDVDMDFLNEKLDLIFNVPQPFQVAFRNREVARVQGIPIVHTFVLLDVSPGLLELHPELADAEPDLGARVFTDEIRSYSITVRATVHDGDLALRASIAFPSFQGRVDVISVLAALGENAAAVIGELVVDLTPADRPVISVRNLALDRAGKMSPVAAAL